MRFFFRGQQNQVQNEVKNQYQFYRSPLISLLLLQQRYSIQFQAAGFAATTGFSRRIFTKRPGAAGFLGYMVQAVCKGFP